MKTTILMPKYPKIIKKKGENRAIFEVENCYPGYGMTLGSAFRRVLLSSLPGAAVTVVKIKGAEHEFSTLPYVLEDVIEIILNLKQIRFKFYAQESVVLILKAKGEKKIKASDIKLTSDIEIINKDAHIATLTDKRAELDMEIEVDSGLGYVPAEQRTKGKLSIGSIAVDAIFCPIKKINYEVENMRVGDRTDFNRLRLDIETDGSISPEDAFQKAARILVEHLSIFIGEEELAASSKGKQADLSQSRGLGGERKKRKAKTKKAKKTKVKAKTKTKVKTKAKTKKTKKK